MRRTVRSISRFGALALALLALGCDPPLGQAPTMPPSGAVDRLDLEVTFDGAGAVVRSPRPIRVLGPSRASPAADADGDGLDDAWEDAVLVRLRPRLRFHDRDDLFFDAGARLAMVGRVWPGDDDRIHVVFLVLYSRDYGRCGYGDHAGDVERLTLALEPDLDGRTVTAVAFYTAAHEGTALDRGQSGLLGFFPPPEAESFPWPGPPPVWEVLVARNKHASYMSYGDCRGGTPCVDDICADLDGVGLAVPVANVGEVDAPRLDDLAALGFPGECIYCGRRFCGDVSGGEHCPAPLAEKLARDPLEDGIGH
jgi:hypothetical protein